MASIPLTNGKGDLDFPDQILSDTTPIKKRAFESKLDFASDITLPAPFHDDLMGNIPIYTIWMRKFADDKDAAAEEWHKFRKDAISQYEVFDRTLKIIEDELNTHEDCRDFLDISTMLDKQANIDAVCAKIDECEETFCLVTKTFEEFSTFLPKEAHRLKVDSMNSSLRERFFKLLQQRNRRREIFRWVIPRLQRYRSCGSEVKTWLDSTEARCGSLGHNTDGSILQCEGIIDALVSELIQKKDIYEDFVSGGKGILSIHLELNDVFNVHLSELEQDINDVIQRWDMLCETLENFLNDLAKKKKAVKMLKKTDTEKVDIKIQDEIQLCTCAMPFKIKKVGDGKYTFGTSKTIRLVRIHGQSIVVRVGGGWEYVYNFLLKVDPCRAKDFAPGRNNNGVDSIHCNTGLTLTPLDNKDSSFTMSVQRMKRTSITPVGKTRGVLGRTISIDETAMRKKRNSLRSSVSIDELDSCGEAFDSMNLGRASPISPAPRETRSKSTSNGLRKNSTSTPNSKNEKFCGKKLSNTDSKLYNSTENVNRPKSGGRRLSLMDRQALYAQKRNSLVHATSVLEF